MTENYGRQREPEAWDNVRPTEDVFSGGVRYVPMDHRDAPVDTDDWVEDPTESSPGHRVLFCHAEDVTGGDHYQVEPAGPGAWYMRAETDGGIYHYERADEAENGANDE